MKSSEEGGYLVSRHPILNGYTKTFENLGSNSLEFNTYQKKNKLDEMQSPELKRSLQENKQSKEFNIKNSLYAISKIEEEERKEI